MDNLGDDFSLTTEHGVIDAKSEFALQMHFRAVRPTNVKKIVRLEVRNILITNWKLSGSEPLARVTVSLQFDNILDKSEELWWFNLMLINEDTLDLNEVWVEVCSRVKWPVELELIPDSMARGD